MHTNQRLGFASVFLAAAATGLAFSACNKGHDEGHDDGHEHGAAAPATPAPSVDGVMRFGAPVPAGEAVALSTVLASPETYAGKTVLVEATVRQACQKKGCWMEVAASGAAEGQGCRVTFKDYGFFVPKDSAGKKARLEAIISVETVSKSDVEHYEGEGGRFAKKNPDGSAQEVRLVANGVELSAGT